MKLAQSPNTQPALDLLHAQEVFHGPMTPDELLRQLETCRFKFSSETELQDGIELVLQRLHLAYEREKVLGPGERPDFFLAGGLAMEIKIKGSVAQALRQVCRYSRYPDVKSIVLVGTPGWLNRAPAEIGGKPVYHLRLMASLF